MLMVVLVFQYLLFSVTDPQLRVKPAGVSDVSLSLHLLLSLLVFWFLCLEHEIFFLEFVCWLSLENSLLC